MCRYITLINFTDKGSSHIKESTARAHAFDDIAAKSGVQVEGQFWTMGSYDLVSVVEAPDDESATAFCLALGAQGNVHTQTLRAFSRDEMNAILAKMA